MFIDEYKNSNESNYEEKDDEIIMKVKNDKENIYVKEKTLYINKKTYKPVKLEIKDNKQKERKSKRKIQRKGDLNNVYRQS